jgi:Flp pilus assembly protein protease CpaA
VDIGALADLGPAEVVLAMGVTVGAGMDAATGRIPNWLTLPMVAVGAAIALGGPVPWAGALGAAAAFAIHFPLFAAGVERGGDAKLLMGIGACVGWRGVVETSLWLPILYLPVGLAVLAAQGKLGNLVTTARWTFARVQAQRQRGPDPGPPPPPTTFRTGPVIAVAALLAWATDLLALIP